MCKVFIPTFSHLLYFHLTFQLISAYKTRPSVCTEEQCSKKNILLSSDFPPVGSALSELPTQFNLIAVHTSPSDWFKAQTLCKGAGMDALNTLEEENQQAAFKAAQEKGCQNGNLIGNVSISLHLHALKLIVYITAWFWSSYHILRYGYKPEEKKPAVASINTADDGHNGYWRDEHTAKFYHPGQPDREQFNKEAQNCLAAYPDASGKYAWGDEFCGQQMNTLCEVTYSGII